MNGCIRDSWFFTFFVLWYRHYFGKIVSYSKWMRQSIFILAPYRILFLIRLAINNRNRSQVQWCRSQSSRCRHRCQREAAYLWPTKIFIIQMAMVPPIRMLFIITSIRNKVWAWPVTQIRHANDLHRIHFTSVRIPIQRYSRPINDFIIINRSISRWYHQILPTFPIQIHQLIHHLGKCIFIRRIYSILVCVSLCSVKVTWLNGAT